MADMIPEANGSGAFRLKYNGIFDYNQLSTYLVNWLNDRKFEVTEGKHTHKSGGKGFEIEWEIAGSRKIDDYFQHNISFKLHLWDAAEVDAVKKGQKVKLWKARLEIMIGFQVICDYPGRFDTSPFMVKLLKFYNRYIIKKEILLKHADPLYYKLLGLHSKLKNMLEMETGTEF